MIVYIDALQRSITVLVDAMTTVTHKQSLDESDNALSRVIDNTA